MSETDSQIVQNKRAMVRPLAYNARQAAKAIGVGTRSLEKNRSSWGVPFKKLGGRIVYPVKSLERWLNGEIAA